MAFGDVVKEKAVEADGEVEGVDEDEGDVEEGPEILRVDLPAVFEDGGEFIQDPAHGVDHETCFFYRESRVIAFNHAEAEEC